MEGPDHTTVDGALRKEHQRAHRRSPLSYHVCPLVQARNCQLLWLEDLCASIVQVENLTTGVK